MAELRLPVVDFSPLILRSTSILNFQLHSFGNVAKEKINDSQFTINLGNDDDEYIDMGSDDDFDHVQSFLLADLLGGSSDLINVVLNVSDIGDNDGIYFGSDDDFPPKFSWLLDTSASQRRAAAQFPSLY